MHESQVNVLRNQWIQDNDEDVNQLRDVLERWTPYSSVS